VKTIVFTPRAARQLDKLPFDVRVQVEAGLAKYVISGDGDMKQLKDRPGYRLRIGRYRVIFSEDRTTILVIQVLKRDSKTYK
jgi:mRNA interferase RelE/StbE